MLGKVSFGVLLSLLLAAVCTPAAIGLLAEAELRSNLSDAGADEGFALAVEAYERGWFESAATLRFGATSVAESVSVAGAAGSEDPEALEAALENVPTSLAFRVEMKHGPLLALSGLETGLSHAVVHLDPETPGLAELEEKLGIEHLIELRAITGLDGLTNFVAEVPALDWQSEEDAGSAVFTGFRLDGSYRASTRALEMRGAAEELEIQTEAFGLAMSQLRFESQGTLAGPELLIGSGDTEIAEFVLTGLASDALHTLDGEVRAEGLAMRFDTYESDTGGTLSFDQEISLEALRGLEQGSLRDASASFTMRNVDKQLLLDWSRLVRELQDSDDEADVAAAVGAILPELADALRASPEFVMGPISFAWANESFESKLRVGINGDAVPADLEITSAAALLPLLPALEADGALTLPKSAALRVARGQVLDGCQKSSHSDLAVERCASAAASEWLDTLVVQGFVKLTARGYHVDFEYADGQLLLNGEALPLGGLGALAALRVASSDSL